MAKRPRISLSNKLEGRSEGPPSEMARKTQVYGLISLLLIPALLIPWLVEIPWLVSGACYLTAAVAALFGGAAYTIGNAETASIARRHAPSSGAKITQTGYYAGIGSLASGLIVLTLMTAMTPGLVFVEGTGLYRLPDTTYDAWEDAINKDDPVAYALCLGWVDQQMVSDNAILIKQYLTLSLDLKRANSQIALQKNKNRATYDKREAARRNAALELTLKAKRQEVRDLEVTSEMRKFVDEYAIYRRQFKKHGSMETELVRETDRMAQIIIDSNPPFVMVLQFDEADQAWKITKIS